MQEAYLAESIDIDTEIRFTFETDLEDCIVKVFFLSGEYEPWLRALPAEKVY